MESRRCATLFCFCRGGVVTSCGQHFSSLCVCVLVSIRECITAWIVGPGFDFHDFVNGQRNQIAFGNAMFEKRTRLRVKCLLETEFYKVRDLEQSLKTNNQFDRVYRSGKVSLNRSTNERNMTRKTRSRRPRIHSIFQSGFCALCHIQYTSLEDHIQSKRHLKLAGDDGGIISIKGFDSFLALDEIEEVNGKNCAYSPYRLRPKMPRTRTSSLMCDSRIKDSPMSPINDSGHHLRSRKNINYMTPPLEEDSLTEKPEVVKEFRELRSSSRLLAKLADQMVENDEVWNSGRPKRSCNKQRISADERLVVDNKSYYKVEVLSSKLRSGATPNFHHHPVVKRPETPLHHDTNKVTDDKGLIVKFKKLRSSELVRLNNEAENFLFPKKDESSEEDDDEEDDRRNDNESVSSDAEMKKIKLEDDESMHSTGSESNKGKRRRRTHAEAFIMDNQKYYKFETPGSRLRYQGSYLSPVPMKSKNNGDCVVKTDPDSFTEADKNFKFNLEDYNFSFESVPKNELWYQTFQRRDKGEEKYTYINDDNYWNPLILPYQLDYVPPLDPRECLSQYNQIKKCLTEPPSSVASSTSATCSTPDPNASNSSVETPFTAAPDEDSKISATENSCSSSTDDTKPLSKRSRKLPPSQTGNGKNPRKSPRQHASTLAILSSLIQQRKRKARRSDLELRSSLPTIVEEPRRSPKKSKIDYVSIVKGIEEDFANMCEDNNLLEVDLERDEEIVFKNKVGVEDLLNVCEIEEEDKASKRSSKPGRKPGKRKKNRTGWPLNRSRRLRRDHVTKEDGETIEDESTVDSVNADSEDLCEVNSSEVSVNNKRKKESKTNSENSSGSSSKKNNDQKSLDKEKEDEDGGEVNKATEVDDTNNCDLNVDASAAVRVEKKSGSGSEQEDKVLTNKVNNNSGSDVANIDLQYQPYVRVQKLDKNHIDSNKNEAAKRSNSPKRTNRGQRRMPASPKSPRMLRRPRGRWYRER